MSAHYRELSQLFSNCVNRPNFDAEITIDETKPIKQLFAVRTILRDPTTRNGIQEAHEHAVIQSVCSHVVAHCMAYKSPNAAATAAAAAAGPVIEIQTEEEARLAWKFLALYATDEESMQRVDHALTKAAVKLHYATARPKQFDMFVHLSAREMFFIDGDSLLLAALSSQQVDWDLMQPLHVIYNAQSLLRRLQCRRARFHVVFFDRTLWFWERSPQKLFIRENLRLTLSAAAESNASCRLVVKTFESYHCAEFAAYVTEFEPEFFLMWDGEQLGSPGKLQSLYHHSDLTPEERTQELKHTYRSLVEDEDHGNDVSFYLQCFQTWALMRRIKVAYASRIIANENAIVVFAVTVDSVRVARALAIEPFSTALARELEHGVPLPVISADSKAVSDEDLVIREQIVAVAVHAYLHRDGGDEGARGEMEVQLAKSFVLMAYVMGILNVELRAQVRGVVAPEVVRFMDDMAPYLLQALRHSWSRRGSGGTEHDIYDGHLLAVLLHHLRQVSAADLLDEDGVNDLNYSWGNIIGSDNACFADTPFTALPEVVLDEPAKGTQSLHLAHELVERLAKRFKVQGHVADCAYPDSTGQANRLSGWSSRSPLTR